uniref:Sushi domain-containing protein n=1 Tax=Tetradesmus obliquus TaxID=3088 RepID=A0A383VLH2_TETOB|eukprot:jgi/Sobl393_1/4154/SZX65544.1
MLKHLEEGSTAAGAGTSLATTQQRPSSGRSENDQQRCIISISSRINVRIIIISSSSSTGRKHGPEVCRNTIITVTAAAVCSAGYGVPTMAFPEPYWICSKCPVGTHSAGNTSQACSKCDDGFTTATARASTAAECIPAVCTSASPAVPGIPAWPSGCNGTSSCTATCSGDWSGTVTVLCGANNSWLPPKQACQLQEPDMQPDAADGSTYSASLALQGPQLGSLSSSPGVLRFTAVVGAGNTATGAVARLDLLPGCAAGPAAPPPEGGWPWKADGCSASTVGQQCVTTCNWPAFDGSGYYVTCLPDGTWSGPGGFCFPRSCSGSPGPKWANSSCAFMSVGSQCTAACPEDQQGIRNVASCTIGGWQVTARDCSNISTTCSFLPTPNAPEGSKGWASDCAGRANGESCQAACDGLNAYFGRGYSALCQDGEWVVQPGGGCRGNLDPKDAGVMGYIGIDVSSSGDIFSTNTGVGTEGVTRWAAGFVGAPTTTRTNWGPFDVAVDGRNGNLLLTDYTNGRVVAFTQAGNLIKTLIDGFGPGGVTGLTIDAVGNIYLLAGSQNGRLLKYDSSGRLIARYGSTFSIPNGVAVGADGAVWVTEQSGSAHKITCMV